MSRILKTYKWCLALCLLVVGQLLLARPEGAVPRLGSEKSRASRLETVGDEAAEGKWLTIGGDRLCVTEGAIEKTEKNRLSVTVPKMRAYVTEWTEQSAEIRMTYLGSTSKESPLGSGKMRRQIGLKLHAHDPCNLLYVMWRIFPASELVVSVKENRDAHTSAECQNHGYKNVKPTASSAVPSFGPGQSHTLRAEMKNQELRVYADNREVWRGDVGSYAAGLEGPVGIRSDNADFEFDLMARELGSKHPDNMPACKIGAANSD